MSDQWRLTEIERRIEARGRTLDAVLARLAAVEQLAGMLAGGMGGIGGDGAGVGSYFADPGSTVVPTGDSEELTVMEVLAAGPAEIGVRTVYNPYPDDTIEDARIMLTRNRDGSYTVANQACAEEA